MAPRVADCAVIVDGIIVYVRFKHCSVRTRSQKDLSSNLGAIGCGYLSNVLRCVSSHCYDVEDITLADNLHALRCISRYLNLNFFSKHPESRSSCLPSSSTLKWKISSHTRVLCKLAHCFHLQLLLVPMDLGSQTTWTLSASSWGRKHQASV